ncbi:hypothetical protein [Lentzea sp. E54]|uniref:hypothetical protein n=1 Tax=Lentzea xerophila TaxID=3435883 RepID=UPI003DA5BBC2
MTRPAPSCFSEDNTRAEGFSGAQIYAQMHGGPGTATAQLAADKAVELEKSYTLVEARLKKVGETLGEAWTGASADAAQAAANPISQAMVQMQDALRQADRSLSNQVYQFNYNKAQLKEMPATRPDTDLWDDVTPWDTDTEDKVNSYNAEEAHNRKVYSEFQSASNTNRGELPKQFPGVTADTLNVEVINTGGDNGEDKTATSSTTTRSSNPSGFPTSTSTPATTSTGWTAPTPNGDQTTTSWADNTGTSGTGKPGGDNLTGVGKPPVGSVIDRPANTGLPPVGVPVRPTIPGPGSPGGPGGSGRGPGGPGGPGGAGKAGGPAAGGKFGTGGLGGTGIGTGTGSGTAAQQPGGKAGVFGGMGETGQNAGTRGGAAAAGAAGRAGAAGMGGMGGHGAKGQGEDDLEHKSADYLITEENTNEIIGDMPMVAPPTIGG